MKTVMLWTLVAIRWYFGLTNLLAGIAVVIAGPVMLIRHNPAGIYFIVGGAMMVLLGFLIHPWGAERTVRRLRSTR